MATNISPSLLIATRWQSSCRRLGLLNPDVGICYRDRSDRCLTPCSDSVSWSLELSSHNLISWLVMHIQMPLILRPAVVYKLSTQFLLSICLLTTLAHSIRRGKKYYTMGTPNSGSRWHPEHHLMGWWIHPKPIWVFVRRFNSKP